MNTPSAAERKSQVREQMKELEKAIACLAETRAKLCERCSYAIREEPPQENKDAGKTPEPILCELANDLRKLRIQVLAEEGVLRDMYGRLEL